MADSNVLVDRVFERLMAMYGSAQVIAKFDGLDIANVKAVWGKALEAYSPHQIGYAIECLKSNNFPPSLPEFLGYCNIGKQIIPFPVKKLELKLYDHKHPDVVEARERCMANMAKMNFSKPGNREWAYRIQARKDMGEAVEPAALKLAQDAISTDPERYNRRDAA